MAAQHSFLDWLNHHLFTCPFKANFGIDCPGCGFQRSVIALLKGDVLDSIKLYPATIPFLLVLIFLLIHLRFDFKFGAQLIKITVSAIAVIVLINYIYKIYTHQLLN